MFKTKPKKIIPSKYFNTTKNPILMSNTNQQQQQQQMLRVVAALGKADFIQVFRYPLPPGLENYSNFVEASLDLSTIFSKVLLMTTTTSTSTENQYTPLEFEDDLVAMLLNCVCYNTQSSDYGALAIRLLSDQLRDIFAESAPSLPLTRRWLQKSSSSDVENDNEEENFVMMRNTALKAVCLDAFHYLAGCEGFKTLVGNDKITSSQNSTIGAIYDYYNNNNNDHHHLLPPRSLVELNERLKSHNIGLYYQNVDQVARDIQLLIQTVIGARTPSTMTTSELNSLLQLRLVHCHRAFRVALDNLKKRLLLSSGNHDEDDSNHHQQRHHELPEKIRDALTLHNCPIQKGLIEKQLSPETKKLIESKLTSSSSADDILNTLKVIVAVLIEKDGSISQGAGTVSFPLFDDQLLRSIDKKNNSVSSFSFSSLYILQCRLISGQLPQTMMDLLLSDSSSNSNKFERKDLIWKTIKGEVEKIITDIVSNYGVEHSFSTLGETFRKQLHTFVSEFI